MSVEIKWLGHASFRIASSGSVLYIDPWKVPDAPHDADAVFVSHGHYDHCSEADVEKVSKDDTTIVAPADVIRKLKATNAITPGEQLWVKDITVEAVAAYNIGKTFHPKDHHWCGAVIAIDKKRIYYAGDTDLIPEMSDLKDVDVALLPVGGTYTLDAAEAANACRAVGCKAAIPYHWGDIVGSEKDAQNFAAAAVCKVHILHPGQSITL
jgi:L-ascorbate metabolism protein UlaG (beta-lactamase superfamily)